MKSTPLFHNRAGFTLIQVLVAVAITGVALVPMISSYVYSLTVTIDADRRGIAIMLGRWKLSQIRSQLDYSSISSQSKNTCSLPRKFSESGNGIFQCELNVSNVTGSHSNFELKKVGICIFYPSISRGKQKSIRSSNSSSCSNPDFVTYVTKSSP